MRLKPSGYLSSSSMPSNSHLNQIKISYQLDIYIHTHKVSSFEKLSYVTEYLWYYNIKPQKSTNPNGKKNLPKIKKHISWQIDKIFNLIPLNPDFLIINWLLTSKYLKMKIKNIIMTDNTSYNVFIRKKIKYLKEEKNAQKIV